MRKIVVFLLGVVLLVSAASSLSGLEARGMAFGAAGVLRAVPALARQGRCLLPADLLAAQGLDAAAVVRDPRAPGLRAVVAAVIAPEAGMRAPAAETMPRAWIAAALPGVLARRDAHRLVRNGIPAAERPRGVADRVAVTWAALRSRA